MSIVTILCGDVKEGGDKILIAVKPTEEGRGDNLPVSVDSLDLVTVVELRDRDLVTVGQAHLGRGGEAGRSGASCRTAHNENAEVKGKGGSGVTSVPVRANLDMENYNLQI